MNLATAELLLVWHGGRLEDVCYYKATAITKLADVLQRNVLLLPDIKGFLLHAATNISELCDPQSATIALDRLVIFVVDAENASAFFAFDMCCVAVGTVPFFK